MSVRHRVLRIAGGLLVGILTTTMLAVAALTFIFHLGLKAVLSGSMRPAFAPGSVIVTHRIPTSELRSGDILVFTPPGLHVQFAHRVVTVSGSSDDRVITTKGDANHVLDPWHAHLIGSMVPVVVVAIPWIGNVLDRVQGLALRLTLLIVAGLLLCLAGTRAILGVRPKAERLGISSTPSASA